MRTLLCVLCCLLFASLFVNGQSNNSADCRTAIPICADGEVILPFADGSGDIDDFGDRDDFADAEAYASGCLVKGSNSNANLENNTAWFVFRAGTGGQVGFNIQSLCTDGTENCNPTAEWDFAVYGPDVSCADIANRSAVPIRCNIEVNDTGFTGLGVNPVSDLPGVPPVMDVTEGNQNTYDEWLDVQPGEIYYILVNNYNRNFDDDAEPFELTFTGSSVEADQDTAIDCTLRDEFLGLDIVACEGDPDITLSALNSPAGSDIASVAWSVDYDDDGTVDDTLVGTGPFGAEYVVASPNSGRYFAEITTVTGTPPIVRDEGGILITFFGIPILDRVEILDTNLSIDPDQNNIEIFVDGNSSYEFAINGGEFQDDPVFNDVPPGVNTVIINDKNGCGITEPLEFLVVGYPKFFTPNGDGMHETWNILGIETLENPVVFVFDRYGKLLKQLNAIGGWDGTFNGQPMPSSDYWFRFEYGEQDNGAIVAKTRNTHFTLKR